jgi:uncharacterized protein
MALTAKTTALSKRTHLSLRRVLLTAVTFLVMLVIALYVGISAIVADKFSRPERHPVTNSPAMYGLAYEPVEFTSTVDNIPLKGWYIGGSGSKVILMLHGRNGNRSDGDSALPLAQAFVNHGYDVFMFDFRAHGESGAIRYSFGELEVRDVAGALAYLKGRGFSQVGTIGFSMGAATALNSAPDHPEMRALVADSSFADGAMLAQARLPKQSGLPPIFVPGMILMGRVMYGMDLSDDLPVRAVAHLGNRPVLLIHGTSDEMIPVEHAYMLQKAGANDPNLQLWILPNVCHTCAYASNPEEYTKRVIDFFDRNL